MYLEKIEQRDVDKKKVVSARVSEDVLSALNIADEESENFGYTFSVTKVIEKALNDTLSEIKDTTGVDYYEWVKWQKKMKVHYEMFLGFIDTKNYTDEVSRVISLKRSLLKIIAIYLNLTCQPRTLFRTHNRVFHLRY